MSVVDKEIVTDPAFLALGSDRIGLLARSAYVPGILAAGHVTASDGTLPFEDTTIRYQLLPGVEITDEEVAEIRQRLVTSRLIVPYSANGREFAFVPSWWRYNRRADRARSGTRTPPIPSAALASFPDFANTYHRLQPATGLFPERPGKARKGRALPATTGVPEPEPEPEPVAALVPAPAPAVTSRLASVPPCSLRTDANATSVPKKAGLASPAHASPPASPPPTADEVLERFLTAHLHRFGEAYRPAGPERGKLIDLHSECPDRQRGNLLQSVDAYIEQEFDATIGGFCDWFRATCVAVSSREVA